MMQLSVISVDYHNVQQAQDLLALLSVYALDPMGGGKPLSKFVQDNLISELAALDGALSVLAYDRRRAVGLLNAFQGFSTFACRPLLNIHDVVVLPEFRGRGIAAAMLEFTEAWARQRGHCKLTLEVLSENRAAQASYKRFGFLPYHLREDAGQAMFWEKALA